MTRCGRSVTSTAIGSRPWLSSCSASSMRTEPMAGNLSAPNRACAPPSPANRDRPARYRHRSAPRADRRRTCRRTAISPNGALRPAVDDEGDVHHLGAVIHQRASRRAGAPADRTGRGNGRWRPPAPPAGSGNSPDRQARCRARGAAGLFRKGPASRRVDDHDPAQREALARFGPDRDGHRLAVAECLGRHGSGGSLRSDLDARHLDDRRRAS